MPIIDKIVLYAANGDSIAGASTFAELLQNAPVLVDSTADTSGMTVTVTGPNGLRAMPLARALQDYLTEGDKQQAITHLKARASTASKLAKWLGDQQVSETTEPTGPTPSTGATGATDVTASARVTTAVGATGPAKKNV